MRILHVGNFGSRAKGAFLHSVAPKLSRGLIRLGHHVVDFADRDVARASTPFGARKFGGRQANRALLRLASDMRPDLLLLGHADTIRADTVASIRRTLPALRVLQWNVDPLFEPDNITRLRSKLDVVDATLVSTAGDALLPLRRAGMALGFLPNPMDASIESGRADLADDLPFDLFFACGHPSRPLRTLCGQDYVKDLSRLGRSLKRTVLVDNDPFSGLLQPCNVLPTRAFYGKASDRCALKMTSIPKHGPSCLILSCAFLLHCLS